MSAARRDCDKRTDIFPRYLSTAVERLDYPDKNFENFKNDGRCRVFLMYLDQYYKIYYYNLEWTEQYFTHMLNVGKECQSCREFYPEKINWLNVAKRLERSPSQALKKNSDGRIGFKNGDKYLVKAYFTFGQRTVQPGYAHIVQTLNVPLVFYLMPKERRSLITKDGLFPYNDLHNYDRRVLRPHGCYRIPPGTTYVLVSTQKNYFSLNIVYESDILQIPYIDPVKSRVKSMSSYDIPPNTPYIEDVHDEANPALEDLFKSIAPQPISLEEFVVPTVPALKDLYKSIAPQPISPEEFVAPVNPQQPMFHQHDDRQPTVHQQVQPTVHQQVQPTVHQQVQPTVHQQDEVLQQPMVHQQVQPTVHQQDEVLQPPMVHQNDEQQPMVHQEQYFVPPLQRTVRVADQDFVTKYQKLMRMEVNEPPIPTVKFFHPSIDEPPLDLRTLNFIDFSDIQFEDIISTMDIPLEDIDFSMMID